jgi:hypothetical protein
MLDRCSKTAAADYAMCAFQQRSQVTVARRSGTHPTPPELDETTADTTHAIPGDAPCGAEEN